MPERLRSVDPWFWLALFAVGLLLPLVYESEYFYGVFVLFGLYAAINLMWVLVLGTAGILSFATLAIVGVGAYLATYLSSREGWSWPAMLAIGAAGGAVLGLIIAVPAIRLRGVYFALFTFGLVELFRSYVLFNQDLGQAYGLFDADGFIPDDLIGTTEGARLGYYAALALTALALVVYRLINGGRLGLLLSTARESEPFARAVGIDVVRARFGVFLVSSTILGLVGGFYAAFYRGVSPSIFRFDLLLLLFAMMVVGGMGSARGVLLGTALLLFIDQHYLESGPSRLIAAGGLMLLITLVTTRGLAGIPSQLGLWARGFRARGGYESG